MQEQKQNIHMYTYPEAQYIHINGAWIHLTVVNNRDFSIIK